MDHGLDGIEFLPKEVSWEQEETRRKSLKTRTSGRGESSTLFLRLPAPSGLTNAVGRGFSGLDDFPALVSGGAADDPAEDSALGTQTH